MRSLTTPSPPSPSWGTRRPLALPCFMTTAALPASRDPLRQPAGARPGAAYLWGPLAVQRLRQAQPLHLPQRLRQVQPLHLPQRLRQVQPLHLSQPLALRARQSPWQAQTQSPRQAPGAKSRCPPMVVLRQRRVKSRRPPMVVPRYGCLHYYYCCCRPIFLNGNESRAATRRSAQSIRPPPPSGGGGAVSGRRFGWSRTCSRTPLRIPLWGPIGNAVWVWASARPNTCSHPRLVHLHEKYSSDRVILPSFGGL